MTRRIIKTDKRPEEINIREAARLSGIPARTISGWCARNALDHRRSGQYVFIKKSQFRRLHETYKQYQSKHGHTRGFWIVRRRKTPLT